MDTNHRLSVVGCQLSVAKGSRPLNQQRSTLHAPRFAFTLVELLVVITIIAILAALLTVAVQAARRASLRARIKAEMTEVANGVEEYKNKTTAYPPNCQTDYGSGHPVTDRAQIFSDLQRHLSQAFPMQKESPELINKLAGLVSGQQLEGGMRSGEALVFWLGGFSSDPKYPISGDGGPSYLASLGNADPIENRTWIFPCDVARLGPRDENGYFSGNRFIEYDDPRFPGNTAQRRRINFWQYFPAKSEQPYLYFDTSRYTPDVFDPPASGGPLPAEALHVHALKRIENPGSPIAKVVFATPDKFQILHSGLDDVWGEDFERTSYTQFVNDSNLFLAFPTGPFTGDMADTIVNFTTESTLEDSQP